jgi:hypothetical protein
LFGENGAPEVNYEIDAFHDELGIAVEVEAGRGAAGNADYRDIVRTSLILDARYMALLLPIRYRTHSRQARARHPRVRQDAQPAQRHLRFTAPPVAVRRCLANRLLAPITCLQIVVSTWS